MMNEPYILREHNICKETRNLQEATISKETKISNEPQLF
jgi:hypothetical protein